VPGSIFSYNQKGVNQLIKDGAAPITCAEDILDEFNINKNPESKEVKHVFSGEERELLKALETAETKEELIKTLGWDARKTNMVISSLEINGILKSIEDKIIKS
jgi:DNA processing protein